ncbi:MAG: glycolate oxidase subunit GlcE, partial [Gammaproteobacteria bacterium]
QACATGNALRVCGGNSKAFLGCSFAGDPLETRPHSGIVDYQPNELVMTVRAGTTLEKIDTTLAENGQIFGFEPPRYSPSATIGGTLACNLSGSGRPWRGSIRDALLGIRLINGRGEQLRFGGRVIKNVAGFDASRLQAGAFGALGVITELSIKVLPQPERSMTVMRELDADTSVQRMNELAGKPVPLSAAAWLGGRLFIRLSGSSKAVESARRSIGGDVANDEIWQQLRDHDPRIFGGSDDRPLWRFSLKSTSAMLLEDDVIIDWAGALRFVRANASLEEMSRLALSEGGHVMRLSQNTDEPEFLQQPSATVRVLHQRLKQAFDPARILNPGRLYGWL